MDLKQTWKVAKVDADWLPLLATANPRGDTAVADTRGRAKEWPLAIISILQYMTIDLLIVAHRKQN